MADLTAKESKFCEEYIKDFNASRAAKAAGYSENTAYSQGQRLLKNVETQTRLIELTKQRSLRTEITQDRILQELAFIAFFDIRNLFREDGTLKSIHELDEKTARALAAVDVEAKGEDKAVKEYIKKIKALDKKGALELLGKHLGMFVNLIRIEDASTGFTRWLEGLYNAFTDEAKLEYERYATANPLSLEEYSFRGSWAKQGENLFN